MTVTKDGQEIAELKHALSVIGSHSYKVLSRTVRTKLIMFPEVLLYFEAR